MNKHSCTRRGSPTRISSVHLLSLLVGLFVAPAAMAAVTLDQSPLTVQQSLPPNIVMMLDDSGSMSYSVMPDDSYLSDNSLSGRRNSSVNGVYYNPATTYTPPPKVDGTLYGDNTAANFPNAFQDPVAGTTTLRDITSSTYGKGSYYITNGSTFNFYDTLSYSCGRFCSTDFNAFAYTGSDNQTHYVASDCHSQTNCVVASDTSGASAPAGIAAGKNVANWYSYYSTRLKLAKSGLLTAFSTLDPTIRFGFGSIDGNNDSNLPTLTGTYNSTKVAKVQPFGSGSSGTQKASFWNWVSGESANNGTPLRSALDAIGQYYQTSQPWQTSSDDSTELACRQSYTILTTDGFWNDSNPSGIGDVDGSTGPTITGPNNQSYTYSPVPPYADSSSLGSTTTTTTYAPDLSCPNKYKLGSDNICHRKNHADRDPTPSCDRGDDYSAATGLCRHTVTTSGTTYSNTLADVAMKYWNSDLRSSTANEVPTSTEDPAFWQHMTTFTVGLGFDPVGIDPSGTTVPQIFNWANGSTAISGFSWPQPASDSVNNIADLAHAALNGHGGFYSAKSPQAFANGLQDALKRVVERVGTGASLAANSTKLETGTVTYQAVYYTGKWKGDLKAYSVDSSTGDIADTPSWTASTQLPAAASRNIWTYNPSGSTNSKFIQFKSTSTYSSDEQTALGTTAAERTNVINYLRGDASNEAKNGGTYRNRDTALGDIVDSQPVYVGAPDPNIFYGKTFTGSDSYSTFASGKASRTPTLWVAANDGMVHAFNGSTGAETFAYLPGAVIVGNSGNTNTRIARLSDSNYGSNSVPHQFFNDGELTVADAYFGSPAAWHTVLVGTTGRGAARAVYAIDVTTPSSPTLLWERSSADGLTNSNYIGQIIGKPVIAQTANGSWSVLIGNGYNSSSDKAALLQFSLSSGSLSIHATGASPATANGLAQPVAWMASVTDNISTTAYAGDLKGKVWSFALGSSTSTGSSLFTATDSGGNVQSITAGLLAGKDPDTGNLWLFFGTGRYLSQAELSDHSVQSWYGIIVQNGPSQPASLVTNLNSLDRAGALIERQITAEFAANSSSGSLGARAISTGAEGDIDGKSGWFIDLTSPPSSGVDRVEQGERMVTPNQFQGSLLIGTSRVPVSSDLCNPSGSGWIMAINPFTGTNATSVFFDLNGDGNFDDSDKITVGDEAVAVAGIGFNSVPNNPIFVGNTMLVSFDNATTSSINTAGTTGLIKRLSWRELFGK